MVSSLSRSLIERGHDVRIFLPAYRDSLPPDAQELPVRLKVRWGDSFQEKFSVFRAASGSLECYFISHPLFSGRGGIYGEHAYAPDPDNHYRFSLFSHMLLEFLSRTSWIPDVIHCHDWTTGLIPYLVSMKQRSLFPETASVMTIHNLAFQGGFSRLDTYGMGIDPETAHGLPPEHQNLLALGIIHADWVTTVSPTYALEVQRPEYGFGLDALLRSRKECFSGIINGVDYRVWDPQTDSLIPQRYGPDSLEAKQLNKQELISRCSLSDREDLPLIGMVSRLAEQKGFMELVNGTHSPLEEMLKVLPMQAVIVGTGDARMEKRLRELDGQYPQLSVVIGFSDGLAHLVEAGSDFFLMPSRYEPCGLNQLYSLRYGTLPIVRRTGGLADTVIDMDSESATGIVFDELTPEGLFEAVSRAVHLWHEDRTMYTTMQLRAMAQDFSWNSSAETYEAVYTGIRRNI